VAALEQLTTAYADLVGLVGGLDGTDQWAPTGCAGWCVRDLVFHLLGDAQRALVALATPVDAPPDTTATTYWARWQPGTDDAQTELRMTRAAASAWSRFAPLAQLYAGTARAVLVAASRADLDAPVGTQGHVLTGHDLLRTLAVEAAVHHLDLVAHLDRLGPAAGSLSLVRETAEGLLGAAFPAGLDDRAVALVATGRRPAPPELADRLPLFG
jgi:hypothetical protein